MNFANVTDWIIPEGSVERVTDSLGIVIWEKEGHNYSKDYFFIENLTNQNNTLSITKKEANAPTVTVYKSTDTVNWESMGSTSTTGITATIPANNRLYLKATANQWAMQTFNYYNKINCTGNYRVGGNIMSLLAGDNYANAVLDTQYTYQFTQLFYLSTTLINAANLILPANVTEGCYYHTFQGCSGLVSAPTLPATTLANSCYTFMFANCPSLTTAPALPATTLANYCYNYMFSYCTSLTTAPALPATTLVQGCYSHMFVGCTSLTTAPALPATTLVERCYEAMFVDCTSLNEVTIYADDISANDCLSAWLNRVAATGDFYNLGTATYPVNSASGIPTGWTEQQYFYVEDVSGSANTLSITKKNADAPTIEVFYSTDKVNWTSMGTTDTTTITATVPANNKLYLKAVTNGWCDENDYSYCNQILISNNCNVGGNIMSLLYGDNFIGKNTFPDNSKYVFSHLFTCWYGDPDNKIINARDLILPATTLNDRCYWGMFSGCDYLLTTPALPATILVDDCYVSMFSGCTALTTAPTLPATTLAQNCYQNMFMYCTALTTSPALPATTLAGYCYNGMFYGCTSLNHVTTYADDISATGCLNNWLKNVAATGDFYNLGSATYPSGTSGIPTGWTEHNTL